MGLIQLLIPALLALPPATAAPSSGFLRVNPPTKRSAPAACASALRKWGKSSPDEAGHLKRASEGLDAKSHENDTFYTVDIQVGSPGQTLPVILDTGSSDLWVYWSETDYAGLGKSEWPKHYDADGSSTGFEITGAEWSVQYADGTQASGPVALDTLTLTTLRLPNATLQLANTTSPSLLDSGASGVMGLARTLRTSIVPYDVPTVRERLVEAGQRFLSIDLRVGGGNYRFSDAEVGGTGSGKRDEGGEGEVTWFESWGSHWTVQVTDFNIGNDTNPTSTSTATSTSSSISSGNGFEGVVDTGTTLLLVPDPQTTAYYATIPSARHDPTSSMWLFPCAQSASLPPVQLTIGGAYTAVVPGALLNFGSVEDHPGGGRADGPEEMCYGGVQSSEGLGVEAILGDVFLKSQLVVLDLEDGRVGFAKKDTRDDGSV